jgi:glycine/D-amino acid oxidase-like deaminating enzyme
MLKRRGVPVAVLERDAIGASWRRHYDRLHLHTVRWLSHLPGLRFNRAHGRWVHRDGVVRYLERYVDHHGLDVRLGVDVRKLDRSNDGSGWIIHTTDGPIHTRAVVVATGYNRIPHIPEWPGRESFEGELLHGQDYRNGEPYAGRNVLVVGSGNTGAEIAIDLVEHGAGSVRLAVRTPPNIVLRETNGVPSQITGLMMRHMPTKIGDPLAAATRKMVLGDLTRYGLPKPPRGLITAFRRDDVVPIIDVGAIELIKQGKIEVVAGVLQQLAGRHVGFGRVAGRRVSRGGTRRSGDDASHHAASARPHRPTARVRPPAAHGAGDLGSGRSRAKGGALAAATRRSGRRACDPNQS